MRSGLPCWSNNSIAKIGHRGFLIMLDNDFIGLLGEVLEKDEVERLVASIESGAAVKSIRINDRKQRTKGTELQLQDSVDWCPYGHYISIPENFIFVGDVAFHGGGYYVQEASSMFLWKVFEEKVAKDAVVLDACAAPGGKSTLINQYLGDDGFLVSNEFVAKRCNVLIENMMKWGRDNWTVTNEGLGKYERLGETFDAVVVDAPCSGEGMFRKDSDTIGEWSMENVMMCQTRQREIVRSAWKTLKNGGVMVYSTCTYNAIEDEENVEWIVRELGGVVEDIAIDDKWGIIKARCGGYHFFPHRVKGEGLFLAVIRKDICYNDDQQKTKEKPLTFDKKLMADWLREGDNYGIFELNSEYWAVRKEYKNIVDKLLGAGLNVRACGVEYGMVKGKDIVPAPGLALSLAMDKSKFQVLELEHCEAMRYLRCEAIGTGDTVRGMVLVESCGYALGWANNVGNRCNNLYPQYWRIRN